MVLLVLLALISGAHSAGILYPRPSETRELISLDGLWSFSFAKSSQRWSVDFKTTDLSTMPVPASYNDVGTDSNLRDYVGVAVYEKKFFVPRSWENRNVWIRFSSVCRAAQVWINKQLTTRHEIGHLPFQVEISSLLRYGNENIVLVEVDNRLYNYTIPQGTIETLLSGRIRQTYTFDFFNYAGIDRPVVLYATSQTYIDDITVTTDISGTTGLVKYLIDVVGNDISSIKVSLLDRNSIKIASGTEIEGVLVVPDANFWWPYLMDPNPGYLYSLKVELFDASENLQDSYSLPVGIRTITWNTTSMKINNKPIYLRGFGRHEDSDIKGKGLDLPLIIRDHNLIRWVGANSYRTSHYPYAEEIMDLADELGIMIIDECPSVNTIDFTDALLENHKQSLTELIQRDKNRPGVIMWSAANEPRTQYAASEKYFRDVILHIKALDSTRPATVVNAQQPDQDHSGQFLDIICFNLYYGWYDNAGDLDVIQVNVLNTTKRWHQLHNVPVIMTEYGADTIEGLHILPSFVWSEEYQNDILSQHFQAFDKLRQEGFFVGEMIWNFADFKTDQETTRVGGNKKGIFTRNRQPKASAHLLRRRYWALAQALDNATVPDDLDGYVFNKKPLIVRDEL